MKIKELIELLSQVDDKESQVYLMTVGWVKEIVLCDIKIISGKHEYLLTGAK